MSITFLSQTTNDKGFTLIELLVTIAIMAILVGGALAGFLAFRDRRNVETAAQEVWQLARAAKTKASVQEAPAECRDDFTDGDEEPSLRGYRLSWTATTFTVTALCALEGQQPTLTGEPVATYNLPNNVNFTENVADPNQVDFDTLYDGARAVDFTFNSALSTTNYQFSITGDGAISDVTPL